MLDPARLISLRTFVAITVAGLLAIACSSAAGPLPPGINARVGMVRGAPAFIINGRPDSGFSYMTYTNNFGTLPDGRPALPHYIGLAAQAGCGLYTFVVDLGALYRYTEGIEAESGRRDFSQVDTIARMIVGAAPPDAMLNIQLIIDTPEWWARQHPQELFTLSNGSTDFGGKLFALPRQDNLPSIASEAWRAECKRLIETFITHVEQSEWGARVMGYQVTGQKTTEWYSWSMNTDQLGDYSRPMLAAFRAWLRGKYGTDRRLREGWRRPEITLASAAIPSQQERFGNQAATFRDPATEQPVIDFHIFWQEIMADTIAYFAHAVKQRTGGTKVVGAFYAYTFEFAELGEDAGHLALSRLLRCPDIDYIMAPTSYYRRELKGGQSLLRTPIVSLTRHGKLFWDDFDPASFKFYEKNQEEFGPWKPWLAVTDTAEEFTYMIRRELGNCLANGANMQHFDLHGGYYDDPLLVAEMARARAIREQALKTDRSSAAQILVVVDEEALHYLTFRNPIATPLLKGQLAELPFVAPFDAVLLPDLAGIDTSRYRLVLVLDAFKLDVAERRVLREKLETGGKYVVWLYAPGYFDSDGTAGSAANMGKVTGIEVAARTRPSGTIEAVFDAALGRRIPGVPLLNADQFVVTDPAGEILARRSDQPGEAVVAARDFGKWTSIYSATAPLPREALRALARRAGVHLYHTSARDAVYANHSYLTLAAGGRAGKRVLRLLHPATVTDLITRQEVCENAATFSANCRPWEVRMYALSAR